MSLNEKITFLMETIPSEEEIIKLKRQYLFGNIEAALLRDASRTLQSSSPDEKLIDWAYELLKLYSDKNREKESRDVSMEIKMERLHSLFSNPEDLQIVLNSTEWGSSDKRAIQIVSHLITNNIPLRTNAKIVDKVYRLLSNAYLPHQLSSKYFVKSDFSIQRNRILESYNIYRNRRQSRESMFATPDSTHYNSKQSGWKRFTYLTGAVIFVVGIFAGGFLSAKLIYDKKAPQINTSSSTTQKITPNVNTSKTMTSTGPLQVHAIYEEPRKVLQQSLENYGLKEKIDFAKALISAAADEISLPSKKDGLLDSPPQEKQDFGKIHNAPLKIAIQRIEKLRGLSLPLNIDENSTDTVHLPEKFRYKTSDEGAYRIVYMTDGNISYPVEIYSFIDEPTIIEYRLINFKSGHFLPVKLNMWCFSNRGEMKLHEHYVYQKGKASPQKIISNHFLPGGDTLELISVEKLDIHKNPVKLLIERKDYQFTGKLLYHEKRTFKRDADTWKNPVVLQVWYKDGKKIDEKRLDSSVTPAPSSIPKKPEAKSG